MTSLNEKLNQLHLLISEVLDAAPSDESLNEHWQYLFSDIKNLQETFNAILEDDKIPNLLKAQLEIVICGNDNDTDKLFDLLDVSPFMVDYENVECKKEKINDIINEYTYNIKGLWTKSPEEIKSFLRQYDFLDEGSATICQNED